MHVMHTPASIRRFADPIALVLALGVSVATCRLDKLINPATADRLGVAPDSAETAFVGSAAPNTFTLNVKNSGALPLTWTATLDTGWVTLSDSGATLVGQDSTPVTVTLDAASLAVGTHGTSINISAPGAIGSP